MTQPVEKRMSAAGPKVGEGARLGRRVGRWKVAALLLAAFAMMLGGVLAPMPWAAVCGVAGLLLMALVVWRADA